MLGEPVIRRPVVLLALTLFHVLPTEENTWHSSQGGEGRFCYFCCLCLSSRNGAQVSRVYRYHSAPRKAGVCLWLGSVMDDLHYTSGTGRLFTAS